MTPGAFRVPTLGDVQRFYDVLRRHPTGVDSLWALVLFGLTVFVHSVVPDLEVAPAKLLPIAVLQTVTVALRRRHPELMLLLTLGYGAVELVADAQVAMGNAAILVIIYTTASGGARWSARLALVLGLCTPTISQLRWPQGKDQVFSAVVGLTLQTAVFVLAWVLGDLARIRRAYYAELEERAARLEREREAQSKIAVAAERARIARELHDVVAHNVSVMVVQADGAAYVLESSPHQAKQALEAIASTGRQALAEMRRLLGVLRSSATEGGEYVPLPGVEQLTDLIDQVRGAGLPVRFNVEGSPRPLPQGVELTAYRIVQEALTNTRKHGGPKAAATVRLTYGDHDLDMLIEDDGRGADRAKCCGGGADGLGHGLIGMRERVCMVGGRLLAGPRPGGGFRISAVLPLRSYPGEQR